MEYTIRTATTADAPEMIALLPRLADFEAPAYRNPDHLWEGDLAMLQSWLDGENPDLIVVVAANERNQAIGVAITSLREELLSHEPSSHLEVLAVAAEAEGKHIGSALLKAVEQRAQAAGAASMSLHVFANNTRARALYERLNYHGELMRYYKPL